MVKQIEGVLVASPAPAIAGKIEARGVGILQTNAAQSGVVALVVDLSSAETRRLPDARTTSVLGVEVATVYGKDNPNLAAALCVMMRGGRVDLNAG